MFIIRCYRRHNIISGVKILEFASDWSEEEAQDTSGTWWKTGIGHDAYFIFRWVEALRRDEREEKNWKCRILVCDLTTMVHTVLNILISIIWKFRRPASNFAGQTFAVRGRVELGVIPYDVNITSKPRNQNHPSLNMFHSFLIVRYLVWKYIFTKSTKKIESFLKNELCKFYRYVFEFTHGYCETKRSNLRQKRLESKLLKYIY